jgi:hypothetical protein
MEREIMPDYMAEEFYRRLIPEAVFGTQENIRENPEGRAADFPKGGPDVFGAQGCVPFIVEEGNPMSAGIHKMRCLTKKFLFLHRKPMSSLGRGQEFYDDRVKELTRGQRSLLKPMISTALELRRARLGALWQKNQDSRAPASPGSETPSSK